MSNEIIVVGGGFAGFWAALAARRVAGRCAEVTLVSRDPILAIRPRLYEAEPSSLGVDLRPLLTAAGVGFVAGEAMGLADRAVLLSDGRSLPFARAVVATGSAMRRPPVPGAELAWSIDTQAEAIRFDARLAMIAATVAAPHIAIIGAGFTGIELSLELADRLISHGGDGKRLRISLFDRAAVVGPELGPGPRAEIETALTAAGVELRLGVRVTGLSANRIDLVDATIPADAVVLSTGMVAADFARHIPGERDELGRVLVARDLRSPFAPAVFVAGDAAAADTGGGHLALQSCQHALQLGRFAGENAARDLVGQPTIPYTQPRYVTCLDLGRAGAVLTQGWDRQVQLRGAAAKALKQRINRQIIYPPSDVSGERLLALSSTDPAQQNPP